MAQCALEFPKKSARIIAMQHVDSTHNPTFLATALERTLLSRIGGGAVTEEELLAASGDRQSAWRALGGCLAKRFVTRDGDGRLRLTEAGRNQL